MSASPVKKLITRLTAGLAATTVAAGAAATLGTAPATSPPPVSHGFPPSSVLIYNSYAQFAADLTSHAITPAYTWVMYDPEYWSATPLAEQQNPALYMQEFGQLA